MMSELPIMGPALPEIFLAIAVMGLMMVGVFVKPDRALPLVSALAIAVLLVAGALIAAGGGGYQLAFGDLFVVDRFAVFMKLLVIAGSVLAIIMSEGFIRREGMDRFEYPVLICLATLGMLMMVSANDLIALYIGLELQSLSLYVTASLQRDRLRSTEAGLKYFVLGALSSGMLLYGASLIYGFGGTTEFGALAAHFGELESVPVGVITGIVFLVAGLAFKVSAVPFHMWTPDVYEGAPTPVTAFFAVAPKIAAMALLLRVMMGPFGGMVGEWFQIIWFVSAASMVLGAFAAIPQTNIKRLMAYSSIGHVGYALIGLAAGTEEGVTGILIYMAIYLVMNVGTFACILSMKVKGRMVEQISDLAGLAKTKPAMAAALLIFMFSMAGIPPMAGFFGKLYVFRAAINAELYTLAVIGALASVVSAFYYLRIVKVMYFDEPAEAFDPVETRGLKAIIGVAGVIVLAFIFYPSLLADNAAVAAVSLLQG
ncbi:NADH-quinone oxidoreductase subunit NuoN [Marivibrio halodurans]|uniref:NADH-quinone oxidoreductase subunit N n=1 Tax=Marivibrio halodurans TaxID=2039722 RepID=A0A8J7SKI6_9PROT|nr:NADH-quinone oxidoreductase subunit NuoN [Marivibrio halodurans]MBP5855531.1 NADH-quinone oxidoreductase subunit NuoN [Marivibrio halodurans]